MGTTQQEEDMTNTTPQVENVVNETSQELHWNDLADILTEIKKRYKTEIISKITWVIRHGIMRTIRHGGSGEGMITSVKDLEMKLYSFKTEYKNNPEYSKLLTHIKNEMIERNNTHINISFINTLVISFVALFVTAEDFIIELDQLNEKFFNTNFTILAVLVIMFGVAMVTLCVAYSTVRKNSIQNFYEICLNILDKQNSDQ